MKPVNVPEKLVKAVLKNRGSIESFERDHLKIFIKASAQYKNRIEIDHIELGEKVILRYSLKDSEEPKEW